MIQSVNERVTILRTKLELSQAEFAAKTGLTQVGVWGIESDGAQPRKTTLEKIASAFGVNREWLFHGTGEMFLPGQSQVNSESVWRDALVSELKEEINFLRNALKLALGSKETNFPNAIEQVGQIFNLPLNSVSASA